MDHKLAIQAKQKDMQAARVQIEQIKIQIEELSHLDDRHSLNIDEIRAQNDGYLKEIQEQEVTQAQMQAAIESKELLVQAQIDAKLHIEGTIAKRQKESHPEGETCCSICRRNISTAGGRLSSPDELRKIF